MKKIHESMMKIQPLYSQICRKKHKFFMLIPSEIELVFLYKEWLNKKRKKGIGSISLGILDWAFMRWNLRRHKKQQWLNLKDKSFDYEENENGWLAEICREDERRWWVCYYKYASDSTLCGYRYQSQISDSIFFSQNVYILFLD